MRSSKLWNRGGGGGSLWHREVPGRSASAASSTAASASASASSASRQSPPSSLPLQQQQHPSSKHHNRQKTSSMTMLALSWLVSSVFKVEKLYLRIIFMLVAICISFWISHYIVSTWPTTPAAANAAPGTRSKALFVSNNIIMQNQRRDQHHFVVEDKNMMIRLDDLAHQGGLPPPLQDHRKGKKRDFGGVDNLRIMLDDTLPRRLHYDVDVNVNNYMKPGDGDDEVDWYYLVDDDVKRNPYVIWSDDKIQDEKLCRKTAWQQDLYLNCNTFHEFDFQTLVLNQKSKHIGAGAYRDAFMAETELDSLIFKESSYSQSHEKYNYEDYYFVRKDGIIAAQLQPHPLLVDTYGWCQLSLFGELAPLGDVTSTIVPRYERCNETFASMNHHGKLIPMNDLSPSRKLEYALQMAESIALLNNYKHGVIVHDDIQLPQWLMVDDGNGGTRLKLNDFNRMEVMYFDEENQEYCRYRNYPGAGDWRAPEEYFDYPLDEKIDIFSLGNNMYALLTGLYPFYQECRSKYVQKRVKNKETPYINPRWKTRSFAEGILVDLIEQCWKFEPEYRIEIGQLVLRLREAVEENKKRQREYMQEKLRKQKEEEQKEKELQDRA